MGWWDGITLLNQVRMALAAAWLGCRPRRQGSPTPALESIRQAKAALKRVFHVKKWKSMNEIHVVGLAGGCSPGENLIEDGKWNLVLDTLREVVDPDR